MKLSYLVVEVTTSLSNVFKRVSSTWLPGGKQPIPIAVAGFSEEVAATVERGEVSEPVVHPDTLLAEARAACEQMLARAEVEAQAAIAAAQVEAQEIRRAAQQAGYDEGFRQGQEEAAIAFAEWKQKEQAALTQLAEQIEAGRSERLHALQPIVEELAMAAVKKLLYRELALAPADIGAMVEDLLVYVSQGTSVQVRVHPDDYAAARQAHPRWKLENYGEWEIAVVPDPTLAPGDCELRGTAGRVDGTLKTRLEELHQALRDCMRGQGEMDDGSRA